MNMFLMNMFTEHAIKVVLPDTKSYVVNSIVKKKLTPSQYNGYVFLNTKNTKTEGSKNSNFHTIATQWLRFLKHKKRLKALTSIKM